MNPRCGGQCGLTCWCKFAYAVCRDAACLQRTPTLGAFARAHFTAPILPHFFCSCQDRSAPGVRPPPARSDRKNFCRFFQSISEPEGSRERKPERSEHSLRFVLTILPGRLHSRALGDSTKTFFVVASRRSLHSPFFSVGHLARSCDLRSADDRRQGLGSFT